MSVRVAEVASRRETLTLLLAPLLSPASPLPTLLPRQLVRTLVPSASSTSAGWFSASAATLRSMSRAPSTRSRTMKCERDDASCR